MRELNLSIQRTGTEPTVSSAQVASGTEITLPEGETTLKVALLVGGVVGKVYHSQL